MNDDYLSAVYLMLAERSRRSGPGSMVGSPVAEVVVVQVDEILLSNPGGRLRLKRCDADKQTRLHTQRSFAGADEASRTLLVYSGTGQSLKDMALTITLTFTLFGR